MFSFSVVLVFEYANASAIVLGLNATARLNTELTFKKQRRELLAGCVELSSLCVLIVSVVISSNPSAAGSASRCVAGENKIAILDSLVAGEARLHCGLVRGLAVLIK